MLFVLLITSLWVTEEPYQQSKLPLIFFLRYKNFRWFLENGYAVVFFHREESLKPYSRKFMHIFEHLQVNEEDGKVVGVFKDFF